MDQNKQRLQQQLLTNAFTQGFTGLPAGATNNDLLSFQLLSAGLSAPSLLQGTNPLASTDLTQWAAAQQQTQWLDQAKVAAAMFGGMGMFGGMSGVKGMDLTNNADLRKAFVAASSAPTSTPANPSPTIFPTLPAFRNESLNSTHVGTPPVNIDGVDGSPAGPSSANPGSIKSVSTPNDNIDVGAISQPHSQLTGMVEPNNKHESPSRKHSHAVNRLPEMDLPSTSMHQQFPHFDFPSTSASYMANPKDKEVNQKDNQDPWANFDLNDINELLTVTGTTASNYDSNNLEFDKEFEKVFSYVQSQDDARGQDQDKDRDKDRDKDKDNFDFGLLDENPALSPVQFTPPDSPSHDGNATDLTALFSMGTSPPKLSAPKKEPTNSGKTQNSRNSITSLPSTSIQIDPLTSINKISPPNKKESIFKKKEPIVKKESSIFAKKSKGAPVYKQKSINIVDAEPLARKNENKDDEYSFTDEEDDMAAMVEEAKKENKLQEEVQRRLAQASAGALNKNIYVPGVGFAVPKEQPTTADPWSHVVPKKRFGLEGSKTGMPPTTLLPPAAQVDQPTTATVLVPEILTLAETIRKRKQARGKASFCNTKVSNDCYCPRENGIIQVFDDRPVEPGAPPPIPKLRISRKILAQFSEDRDQGNSDQENFAPVRRLRKRRKSSDDDDGDWRGYSGTKSKQSHKTTRRSSRLLSEQPYSNGYPSDHNEPQVVVEELYTPSVDQKPETLADPVMMTKKARLMQQWKETEDGSRGNQENHLPPPINGVRKEAPLKLKIIKTARNEQQNQEIKMRLAAFGPAEGYLPKGTFVVCKKDLFKDDCALWRVDNQNMLQKYPPRIDPETKRVTYRNSSTYSGWCEQIAADYATIAVRFNKQTRSEAIVEPEVPLSDLFPAVTAELNGSTETCAIVKEDEPKEPNEIDPSFLLGDPSRMTLHTYILAMLQHVLTLDYFREVREKNDPPVFQSMVDVVKRNRECLETLRLKTRWDEDFETNMDKYLRITDAEMDVRNVVCQACHEETATKIEQLFDAQPYNRETLEVLEKKKKKRKKKGGESPLQAMELLVCESCLHLSKLFHRCLHMRYFLFKECEDHLEDLGNEFPELSPEKIIEKAKGSSAWLAKLVLDTADLWKKVKDNEF